MSHSIMIRKIKWDVSAVMLTVLVGLFCAVCAAGTLNSLLYANVYAAANLTALFDTLAFKGSMEVVQKWDWIGAVLNWIISIFSLVGLVMVLYQRLVSLLYLSSRNVWDTVYDLKSASNGDKDFAAFRGIFQNIRAGDKGGTGTDVIVGFMLSLLPNIKKYSDYNPDRMGDGKGVKNLSETDGAGAYMLKTAAPTVLIIFFFAIGFSGTLAKAYGMVVDAMAVAADAAVDANLDRWLQEQIATGAAHNFSIPTDTSMGRQQRNVAGKIYSEVMKLYKTDNEVNKLKVGQNIEEAVLKFMSPEALMNGTFEGSSDITVGNYTVGLKNVRGNLIRGDIQLDYGDVYEITGVAGGPAGASPSPSPSAGPASTPNPSTTPGANGDMTISSGYRAQVDGYWNSLTFTVQENTNDMDLNSTLFIVDMEGFLGGLGVELFSTTSTGTQMRHYIQVLVKQNELPADAALYLDVEEPVTYNPIHTPSPTPSP